MFSNFNHFLGIPNHENCYNFPFQVYIYLLVLDEGAFIAFLINLFFVAVIFFLLILPQMPISLTHTTEFGLFFISILTIMQLQILLISVTHIIIKKDIWFTYKIHHLQRTASNFIIPFLLSSFLSAQDFYKEIFPDKRHLIYNVYLYLCFLPTKRTSIEYSQIVKILTFG